MYVWYMRTENCMDHGCGAMGGVVACLLTKMNELKRLHNSCESGSPKRKKKNLYRSILTLSSVSNMYGYLFRFEQVSTSFDEFKQV